jgi:hypothetical protein
LKLHSIEAAIDYINYSERQIKLVVHDNNTIVTHPRKTMKLLGVKMEGLIVKNVSL